MPSPVPNALTQFIDNRGNPLANGTVSYFQPGTSIPKPTWRDPGLAVGNANPVVLDANGRAPIFGTGRYRQQVRAANGALVFEGETALGESLMPLASEIAGIWFDNEIRLLRTSGFATPGKGVADYVRLSGAPSAIEQQAGLGRWLFRSNANTVWWRLAEPEPTDLMFGVLAEAVVTASGGTMTVTGPDDTAALQAAIDYVLYFGSAGGAGRRLRLPAGMRRITRTIQIGYGTTYLDWQIDGDFFRGFDDNAGYHAGIYAAFNDRPAFNIQGARSARLSGIAIYGLNHAWLDTNEDQITDRSALANWRGGQLQPATVNTRHAPYAGIAVDGYSGSRQPASSYPDIAYPAWLGAMAQYDKGFSSYVEFNQITCAGFEVGIAVQPNLMPSASNGDFLHFLTCDLGGNLVGTSISHADARTLCFERSRFHGCHTAIDSVTYGAGAGNLAASLANCSFDRVYRVLNVDLGITLQPFAPTMVFTNAYGEAMYTLGTVRQAGASGRPGAVRFIGGELGFFLRSGEHSPASYLDGRGEVLARFEDVSITGTFGLFGVNCDVEHFSGALPAVAYHAFDQTTKAGRRAASALCGIDAPRLGEASVRPFTVYGVDNSAQFGLRCRSHGFDHTGGGLASGLYLPLMVRSVDHGGCHIPIAHAPAEVLDRAVHPLGSLVRTGIEWTFTASGDFLSDPDNPGYCLGQGDIVQDEATGHVFYVKTVAFNGTGAGLVVSFTLRQVTGVRSSDGVTWSSGVTLAAIQGRLRFRCARRLLAGAKRRLGITTSAGSGVAAFAAIGPEIFAPDDLGGLTRTIAVGDYVLAAGQNGAKIDESVFARGRVVGFATSGGLPTGEITLDTAARRSGFWPAPVFIKGD